MARGVEEGLPRRQHAPRARGGLDLQLREVEMARDREATLLASAGERHGAAVGYARQHRGARHRGERAQQGTPRGAAHGEERHVRRVGVGRVRRDGGRDQRVRHVVFGDKQQRDQSGGGGLVA